MFRVFCTLSLTFICTFPLLAQFAIGHTTFTFNDPTRSGGFGSGGGPGRQIQTEIYYPANTAGTDVAVAAGDFPVLVFGHGFAMEWSAYENIWQYLVPEGYIIAFPRTEGSILPAPSHADFGLDIEVVGNQLLILNSNASSLFFGHTNAPFAYLGHSMGGGAAVIAAANNNQVSTYIGMAPAETNPSAISAAANVSIDALVLSGSSDGVTPPSSNHLPIYNAMTSNCKTYVSINNGSHCYFANTNFFCDLGELAPGSLSRAEQQEISLNLTLHWLDFKLKGDCDSFLALQDSLNLSNRLSTMQSCNVNITPVVSYILDTALCAGELLILPTGQTLNTATQFTDTVVDGFGCDSLYLDVTLAIELLDTTFETIASCSPNDTGIVVLDLTSAMGCDSVHQITTILSTSSSSNTSISACDSLNILGGWIFNDTILYDTIFNGSVNGCDSVVNYILTVSKSSFSELDIEYCFGDSVTLPNGVTTADTGVVLIPLINGMGCDSLLTIRLNWHSIIASYMLLGEDSAVLGDSTLFLIQDFPEGGSAIVTVNSNVVTNNLLVDSFRVHWMDTGIIAVAVTLLDSNCSSTLVWNTYVYSNEPTPITHRYNSHLMLHPNPTKDIIYLNHLESSSIVTVYDINQAVVLETVFDEPSVILDVSHLLEGVYFLQINDVFYKIIKE